MIETMAANVAGEYEKLSQKDVSKFTEMADLDAHEEALANVRAKMEYWDGLLKATEPVQELPKEKTAVAEAQPDTEPLKEETPVAEVLPLEKVIENQPQEITESAQEVKAETQPTEETKPEVPTAEQKIAQGTVKENVGRRFAFQNEDGTHSEIVIDAFKGDDQVEVTRQDYDASGDPRGEAYKQDLGMVDIGNSIVNGMLQPVLSVEERLRNAYKGKPGMQNIIDVLTDKERRDMLSAVERGDQEALRDMTNEFVESHREDIILNERDKRNDVVRRIMEGNGSREEKLRRVRKEYQGYDDAVIALSDEAIRPTTLEEYVSDLHSRQPKSGEGPLAYFSYDVDGNKIVGMQDESGHGTKSGGDTKGYAPWLAPKGKGMSLQRYAETLHEQLPEAVKEQYSDQDVRNAILSVFAGAERPSDITTMTLRRGILQAEQAARRMEEMWIDGPSYQKALDGTVFAARLQRAVGDVNTEPTEGQKAAGNYKKGHLSFGGYDYTIENPAGSVRRGKDATGHEWQQRMNNTYGYILGRYGKDGDHLDMFINDGQDLDAWNGNVYVVDQVDPRTGKFDEHKVMYGFDSLDEAKKAYLANYEEGWQGLGTLVGVTKEGFDKWLDSSKRKQKEFAEHSIAKEHMVESEHKSFDSAVKQLNTRGISMNDPELMKEYGLKDIVLSKTGDHVTLSKIVAETKGQGNGTRFMEDLARLADERGWTLALTPSGSFGAKSIRRLKDFYKRFGFKDNKGRNTDFSTRESMVRPPKDVLGADSPERQEQTLRDAVVDHLRHAGVEVSTDWKEGQRILDGYNRSMDVDSSAEVARLQKRINSLSKAERFIEESLKGNKQNKSFEIILPESTQRMIRREMGRDYDSHNIAANSMVHSKKNHGENGVKITENSIPLRDEDFKLAPHIMVAPDRISKGSMDPSGRESARFEKDLSNGMVLVVEKEQKNSPDDMDTIPMWAEKSIGGADARSNTSPVIDVQNVISDIDAAKIRKDSETAIGNDEKISYFKTPDGHAYGYTYRGKIYVDPRIATAETPVHEYGHLWCEMKREAAPEEWNDIKQVMLNDSMVQPIIEKVRAEYPELSREGREDDFVEEIITQFSGKQGNERLHEIAQEIAQEKGGVFGKAEAVAAMQRLKNILNRFWAGVAKMMGWKYTSASQIADRIMADMLNGVNPRSRAESIREQRIEEEGKPTFFSNALYAVDHINQEKATPEQWLAMITKNGGMKAGEDKWLGLSDWLKNQEKKSLTKQEVMDYIRQNQIQVEETEYAENVDNSFDDEIIELWHHASGNNYDKAEEVNSRMIEKYGEDFRKAAEVWYDGSLRVYDQALLARIKNGEDAESPINDTRLSYTTDGLENKREIALVVPSVEPYNEHDEVHFGDAGGGRAVAWVRFGETTDADGKKVLVIDEIQSKRHQDAREKGYKPDEEKLIRLEKSFKEERDRLAKKYGVPHYLAVDDIANVLEPASEEERAHLNGIMTEWDNSSWGEVPAAPFEKNWHELAMKRMLRYAAENGYDKVAWTKGEQQAERYDLGGVIEDIYISKSKREPNKYAVTSYNKDANVIDAATGDKTPEELSELFGKELAQKLIDGADNIENKNESFVLSDQDLKVGGERMKGFYDQILPRFMDKYGKKWGVKVEEVDLPKLQPSAQKMWSIDVTPDMRASVMQGQPMFQKVAPNGREYLNPRTDVPKVRGGWNERKIKEFLKHHPTRSGIRTAARAISEFDSPEELKEHMFYHGTAWGSEHLKPSITMSDRDLDRYGGGGYGDKYWGVSVSKDKKIASRFSSDRSVRIYPIVLLKGANVIERPDFSDAYDAGEHIVDLWNDGVDAVWIGEGKQGKGEQELLILNPRAVVNIGTPDFYQQYKLGLPENPLHIADDEAINRMYKTARQFMEYHLPKKPVKPSRLVFENGDFRRDETGNLFFKSDAEYESDLEDYNKRMDEYNNSDEKSRYEEMEKQAYRDIRFQKVPDTAHIDKEYADAVAAGDKEKVDAMLREEADRKGYSEDSEYQGSKAFNGAAPSKNAYFETREERKQALEDGDFEGEFSLGDFVEAGIDANDLEWQLSNPRAATAGDKASLESIQNINNAIRSKSGKITMYRAVDADIKENSFRNGDWVTPSRKYAMQHIELQDWKKGRIIEKKVPIDDIWWNGDDINEWGYDDGKMYAYKNTKNNRKLMEPTYDADGNLIPLSQRFDSRKDEIMFQKQSSDYDKESPKFQNTVSPEAELTPEERQYWKQWDDAMRKWKERNAIPEDQTKAPEKPRYQQGESAMGYAERLFQWTRQSKLWQTAPKLEDYRQVREDKDIVEAARENEQRYPDSPSAKMRRAAAELLRIRHAVSRQKAYDKATVKAVTDFAQDFMKLGFGDNLGRGELERMLSSVKNATGAKDIKKAVDNIMNILIDNHLRNLDQRIVKLSSVKELSKTAQGVEKQGRLELKGQRMIQAFREARENRLTVDQLRARMAEVAEKMGYNDEEAPMWEQEYEGLSIALQYAENIDGSRQEWADLNNEYKNAVKDYKASGRSYKDQQELLESLDLAMQENKIERIASFGEIIGRLEGNITESVKGAREFVERDKQRVRHIQDMANADLAGKDMGAMRRESKGKPANLFLQPLGTFEQMLKQFGSRNVNGEGYLYDYYMRNWLESTNNAFLGDQRAKSELDAKAREVFGDKVRRWSDLYQLERDLPMMDVEVIDGGEKKTFTLTQGNLLYIYMADKMNDGRMKLRKMGIDEEAVEHIKEFLDPRLVQLGDWLQEDYLRQKRTEYNKIHERMFGAPMAAIENYFPIRVLQDARYQEQDVNVPDSETLPSTIVGNIIKRQRNALPLDILHTDALSVAVEHVEDMERWAAMAEWNRDVNTLLSYTTFRNKVKNQKTIYGSGDALWNAFKDAAKMAAGTYDSSAKSGHIDKAISNLAKGVTAAKISFRPYTAFKQILSAPAFLHDVRIDDFVKNSVDPYGSWKWAMENMPIFRKRWKSRQAGDTRLMDDPTDWKMWKNNIVQIANRMGMSPNALVDGVTCAVGARSIYEGRYRRYKEIGASDEVARKRALQDAEIGYNLTQQSSEGAFVSAIQKDRTVAANMLSVFRNSSMSYTRQWVDASRNLKKRLLPGYKEDSIGFMARQMAEQFDLDETQARRAAELEYAREGRRDVARLLNMMFGVTVAWNLGASLPYLLLGDDNNTKEEMLTDALLKGMIAGPVEGFAAGNIISDFAGQATNESVRRAFGSEGTWSGVKQALKNMGEQDVNPLPLFADVSRMIGKLKSDELAAAQEVFNIAVQSSVGVNPQTFTDMWNACMDYGAPGWDGKSYNRDDRNLTRPKEIALFIMRVLNAPTSSWKNKYIDELGLNAEDAQKLPYEEMARRYAHYKHWKDAPLMGWLRSDEARAEKMEKLQKQFDTAVEERMARLSDQELASNLARSMDPAEKRKYAKLAAQRMGLEPGPDSQKPDKDHWYQEYYQQQMTIEDINEDELLDKKYRDLYKDYNEALEEASRKSMQDETNFYKENADWKRRLDEAKTEVKKRKDWIRDGRYDSKTGRPGKHKNPADNPKLIAPGKMQLESDAESAENRKAMENIRKWRREALEMLIRAEK